MKEKPSDVCICKKTVDAYAKGTKLAPEDVEWKPKESDAVNHPAHYNSGRFEVAEVIEDWGLNFRTGNSVKYIARAGKKDPKKHVEDLQKAIWYLRREIYVLEYQTGKSDRLTPNQMSERSK